MVAAAFVPASAKKSSKPNRPTGPVPLALFDGGRHLDFVRFVSSEKDLHEKRSFLNKIIDVVAGAPEWRNIVRPYAVATDSRGRILVTDPGAAVVHIFDFAKNKYTRIEGGKKDSFLSPIGITVDSEDNIYVTDSRLGKVLVFDSRGKYLRVLGDIKGEGFFKRPTGIAYDKTGNQLFVTDTLRDRIFVTDLNGNVLRAFGTRGTGAGEFNFPTEVVVHGQDVFVVDAMNFRVQMFDTSGKFQAQFGGPGDQPGRLFRPKGLGVDVDGNIYLVDASMEAIEVFRRDGQLLYSFGRTGSGAGQFQLPSGLWIDGHNEIYVADSYNHRIQVFRFVNGATGGGGQK
jgi:DNA-binding beta-propeller fold protein YncE